MASTVWCKNVKAQRNQEWFRNKVIGEEEKTRSSKLINNVTQIYLCANGNKAGNGTQSLITNETTIKNYELSNVNVKGNKEDNITKKRVFSIFISTFTENVNKRKK